MSDTAYLIIAKEDGTVLMAEIEESLEILVSGKTVLSGKPVDIAAAIFDRLMPRETVQ